MSLTPKGIEPVTFGLVVQFFNQLHHSVPRKNKIYKTIILPVFFYGCETWSVTLRKELRLRVFVNRVQVKIFGHKRDEVTGERRRLRIE